jgi:chromosome partitioning protein
MRILAFMNQKGGVAKTTTTVNLGAALAEMGARVLLLDLDPQSHLTINYGVELPDETADLFDVICGDASFADAIVPHDKNVAIAAGSLDLASIELQLAGRPDRATVLKTKMAAASAEGKLAYDYVLIDCPPSLGLLTLNALAVAGEVFVPMQPHFLAMQGMAKLLDTVRLVNKQINPRLKIGGIVLTMFDSQTKLSGEVVNELEQFFEHARGQQLPWSEARVCRTKIRRNIKLAESPSFGQPVLKYDSASNGSTDYRALAREVATMRAWPTGLDKAGAVAAPMMSLVERAIDAAEKPEATVHPIDASKLAATRADSVQIHPTPSHVAPKVADPTTSS